MKTLNRSVKNILVAVFITTIMSLFVFKTSVLASSPTDEILDYTITVDVNEDATLDIRYDISWLVLESDSLGPVTWVEIGIPNSHNISYEALSDNIDSMHIKNSGGNYAVIDFDSSYYEGEQIDFSFAITQDYMYSVNGLEEGYSTYTFTPGWFDEIKVDNLEINWNSDNVYSFSPECIVDNGYNTWTTWLDPGDKYTVKVTYPNDAYGFDLSMPSDDYNDWEDESLAYKIGTIIGGIIVLVFGLLTMVGPIVIVLVIAYAARKVYDSSSGFGTQTTQKITRTKIEYYPVCQGCGATRPEGTDKCVYCGRSFIKSQETVTEDQIPENEKDVLKHRTSGTYAFAHSPNTYMRVNVINVPKPRPTVTRSSGGSHHSSCAHSSCACACACACAGGGRAGCTNKDFYNTNLKLAYLERYKKSK